jgi:hypothetical protein
MLLDIKKNMHLVLTGVKISADLLECFGKIHVTQTYENNTKDLLEVVYIFPLTNNDSITNFSISINNKKNLTGVLKSKHVAEQEYNEAVSNKQTASFLEKYHDGSYRVKIGNVEPGTKVVVNFTYVTFLTMRDGKYIFVVPTNIAPKYQLGNSSASGPTYGNSKDKQNFYKFLINVTWNSKGSIKKLESFTHANNIQTVENSSMKRTITAEVSPLEGDFNLALTTDAINYPIIYQHKDVDDTYLMVVHKIDERETKFAGDTEYIFLVDRSGSMSGSKMAKAKEALEFFLRSLPAEKCHYNIVSFGDNFTMMYNECIKYTDSNVQDSLNKLKIFDANMGGTELHKVIHKLLTQKSANRRCYFLLTDGQVYNGNLITDDINKLKKQGDRFFTLGVGKDADRNLIEEIAIAGHGNFHMVVDTNNSLSDVIVQLLDDSTKEYYYNLKFDLVTDNNEQQNLNDCLGAVVTKHNYVIPNKQFVTGVKISKSKTPIQLKVSATIGSSIVTQYIDLKNIPNDNELVKQVYGKYILENLENGTTNYSKLLNRAKLTELEIEESLKYGILGRYTGFVVVDDKAITLKDMDLITHNVPHYNSMESLNNDWFDDVSEAKSIKQRHLINVSRPIGVNTIGSSFKNQSCDINGKISAPQCAISPWLSSNIEPECYEECESCENDVISCKSTKSNASSKSQHQLARSAKLNNNDIPDMTLKYLHAKTDRVGNMGNMQFDKSLINNLAECCKIIPKDIIEFQKIDGSFNISAELLELLNTSDNDIKKTAQKLSIDYNLAVHIHIIKFLQQRNRGSDKLILKKLISYVTSHMGNKTLELN